VVYRTTQAFQPQCSLVDGGIVDEIGVLTSIQLVHYFECVIIHELSSCSYQVRLLEKLPALFHGGTSYNSGKSGNSSDSNSPSGSSGLSGSSGSSGLSGLSGSKLFILEVML
jgi:uncharacterized membrane protein YgcG